ncbi:FAD-dependent oxidoreductase [Lentzea sp. NPDC059081]|uniref:FAD-dependent oxidoreductase n=1 Tax=Lentzea sp. NPDC059081 TaxID=3346719 RepID=UPI0036C3E4B4
MYSDRALVIGAGFAGLLAARVLSESYGDVVVVERDRLAADTRYRSGVPQAHHPHALHARGAEVLSALFPRFGDELVDAGAVRADVGSDHLVRFPTGWAPRDHLGLSVLSATRVTIERTIRRRVLKLPNVSIVDGVAVEGLLHDRGTVTGVHGTRDDRPFTDYADLVVDASGHGSKLVPWLAEQGVHCPAPMIVNGHTTCTSRLYHLTEDLELDWKTARELTQAPRTRRGGTVSEVDGRHWFVSLSGADGDAAPDDEDGFAEYAATLQCQDIAEIVKTASPASAIHRSGTLRSRWNRYHQVQDWPRGLLALGDAVASLNPVHGHGMTLAALHCAELHHLLQGHDLAKEPLLFQRAVARTVQVAWKEVTTADLGWGDRKPPLRTRLRQWYARRLTQAIPGSTRVYRAYVRVTQMADRPVKLLAPAVLWRVLSGSRLRATGR